MFNTHRVHGTIHYLLSQNFCCEFFLFLDADDIILCFFSYWWDFIMRNSDLVESSLSTTLLVYAVFSYAPQ